MAVYQKKTIAAQEQAEESELITLGVHGGFQVCDSHRAEEQSVLGLHINIRQESFHSM